MTPAVVVVGGACAICLVAPSEHARCGVCECSVQIVLLCAHCEEWNRLKGVAWNAKALPRSGRRDEVKTRRRGRPRDLRIDGRVIARLLRRRVRATVRRIDQFGRLRGTYEVWTWPSRRQIARDAGCGHSSVDRRYHDYGLRPIVAVRFPCT